MLSRVFVFANMADMFAGFEHSFESFDELINSAIGECDIGSRSALSNIEKERVESQLLKILPEDYEYKLNNPSANTAQKSSFLTKDITTENVDFWLTEFQTINSITLKIKTKKKPAEKSRIITGVNITPEDGDPAKILRENYTLIQQQTEKYELSFPVDNKDKYEWHLFC